MTDQPINLRNATNDCWFVNRYSDDAQRRWTAIGDAWFIEMKAHWIMAYREVSNCPQVPYQFVLRCQPIIC